MKTRLLKYFFTLVFFALLLLAVGADARSFNEPASLSDGSVSLAAKATDKDRATKNGAPAIITSSTIKSNASSAVIAPSISITSYTGAVNGIPTGPVSYGDNTVMFAFGLTVTGGTITVNKMCFTRPTFSYYSGSSSGTVYNGPDANFANATIISGATFNLNETGTMSSFAGLSDVLTNTTKYYFFVMNYDNVNAASGTEQFSFVAGSSSSHANVMQTSPSASYNVGTTVTGPLITMGKTYDWAGKNTNWSDPLNFKNLNGGAGAVPTSTDHVRVGVKTYASGTVQPTIPTSTTLAKLTIGTKSSPIVTTAGTLTITGDLDMQSDWADIASPTANFNANGTVAVNGDFNVGDGQTPTPNTHGTSTFEGLNVSLATGVVMTVTGNLNITGSDYAAASYGPGTLNLTGNGTLTVNGSITTSNSSATGTYHSSFVMGANNTLNLAGSVPFAVSPNGSSWFGFGGNQNYTGTSQTVAADLTFVGNPAHYGNLTFSGSGTKQTNTGSLYIDGNFTNSSGVTVDFTTNGTPVYLAGTVAQAVNNNSAVAVTFPNLTISGNSSTKTLGGTGTFNLASTGTLTLSGNATTILAAGTSKLTLKSDINGAATVGNLTGTGGVTGTVYAERYIKGGTAAARGYRFLSSPVSTTTVTLGGNTYNGYTMQSLIAMIGGLASTATIITGPPAGTGSISSANSNGFDTTPTGNYSAFVYQEPDADPLSTAITSSDFKGIANISQVIPMGTGILFYNRGDRSIAQANNNSQNVFLSTPGGYPTANTTTIKFSGAVLTGPIVARAPSWTAKHVTYYSVGGINAATVNELRDTLAYNPHVGSNQDGFNLVGNPFPSTIDLEKVTFGAGIDATIVTLNPVIQAYGFYQRSKNPLIDGTATNEGSRYVLSGEGFFVKTLSPAFSGTNANRTVVFPETAKTAYPSGASIPTVFSLADKDAAIRIRLVQDSVYYNETLISFNSKNVNAFEEGTDVSYLTGPAQLTFMYSYTSEGAAVAINRMNALEKVSTIPLYASGSASGTYKMQFSGLGTIDSHYVIYLKDAVTKDSVNIATTPIYSFTINRADASTYGANRFTLVVHKDNDGKYQLLTFSGEKIARAIKLTWTTKNESDVMTWELQRSIDGGKTYVTLGTVQANKLGTYNYTDNGPVLGTDIYRLKQSDVNDDITYSELVSFTFDGIAPEITNTVTIYPNPTASRISIDFTQKITNPVQVNIVNTSGKTIKQTTLDAAQHINQDVSALPTGIYIVDIYDTVTNQKLSTSKLIKN